MSDDKNVLDFTENGLEDLMGDFQDDLGVFVNTHEEKVIKPNNTFTDVSIDDLLDSPSEDELTIKAKEDIVWVKVIYPDLSTLIFRGTQSNEIANSIGKVLDDDNFILDVGKERVIDVTDCEVSYHDVKPEYERRIDSFANNFI